MSPISSGFIQAIEGEKESPKPMPLNALRRDGSSQQSRFPAALDKAYFQIDERNLEDLLDFILKFSREVRYYALDNKVAGNWENFFENDPTVLLAKVLRFSLAEWKNYFDAKQRQLRTMLTEARNQSSPLSSAEKLAIVQKIIGLHDVILYGYNNDAPGSTLNFWTNKLRKFPAAHGDFQKTLQGQVKKQMQDLIQLRIELNLFTNLGAADFSGENYAEENDPWDWEILKENAPFLTGSPIGTPRFAKGTTIEAQFENIFVGLARIGTSIVVAIEMLQKRSRKYFENSLTEYDVHGPHLGLLIGFLQVFQKAQARLNDIGPRHLDFYYKKGLGFQPKAAQADHVYLIAELSAASNKLLLPSGTEFEAKDNRIYASRQAWNLNNAQLVDFRTDYTQGGGLQAFQQVMKEGDVAGENPSEAKPAKIGWAIGSPMLLMEEGRRECWIAFGLDPATSGFASFTSGEKIKQKKNLESFCKVQITADEKWLDIPDFTVEFRIAGANSKNLPGDLVQLDNLLFHFVIPTDAPAIINYDPEVHEGDFDCKSPMLKFSIERNAAEMASARKLLSKFNLHAFGIDLNISGMKNMRLENDEGDLIGSEPFTPFGQSPVNDNKFYVDAREALAKRPTSIKLSWKWKDLPEVSLQHYFAPYRAYYGSLVAVETTSYEKDYTVEAACFIQNRFVMAREGNNLFSIFDRNTGSATFSSESLGQTGKAPIRFESEGVNMRREAAGGFIRLRLKTPAIAFGHAIYPSLFAQAAITMSKLEDLPANAHALSYLQKPFTSELGGGLNFLIGATVAPNTEITNPDLENIEVENTAIEGPDLGGFLGLGNGTNTPAEEEKEEEKPVWMLPGAPITPTMGACTMTYQAAEETVLSKGRIGNSFWHIDHHGHAQQSARSGSLIAQYNQGAYLYLGIDGLELPAQLNVLFQLKQGSGAAKSEIPAVAWSILDGNLWRPIPNSQIASDKTVGLRKSGIVVLNLLPVNQQNQTAMPAALTWLRIEIDGDTNALDKVAGIYLNAFEVSLENTQASNENGALAAKSLTKPRIFVDGLKAVSQPYMSFGGQKEESNTQFQSRVSERLRHKNRSISLWDYERIVLEKYPEIYKVNCLNHYLPGTGLQDNALSPGHIALICIPKTPNLLAPNPLQPYCRRDLLRDIEEDLQADLPPFATLHVTNPIYEEIVVKFKVVFNAEADAGTALLKLNEAIARYLCPWAFDAAEEIHFGGKVHPSQLLHLLERQMEVDVIADFEVFAASLSPNEEGYFEASHSRMVLVAAQKHKIEAVAMEDLKCEGSAEFGGINFWRINQDFIVNGN